MVRRGDAHDPIAASVRPPSASASLLERHGGDGRRVGYGVGATVDGTPTLAQREALRLVVPIEDVANPDDLVAELGEVARGRLDRRVPEPCLDLLDRHTLAGQRRRVVTA